MSKKHNRLRRRLGALIALTALAMMLVPPASAAVPFKDAAFSGYATGTYLHADALTIGTSPTLKVDAGFAAASVNSKGLTAQVNDELGRAIAPVLAGKNSYGAGFGLDVNLLGGDLLAEQQAAAAAPPSTDLIIKRVVDLSDTLPGVLAAGALEGRAQARYDANTCILGADMSYGQGDVADLALLGGPLGDLTDALLGTNPGNQDPGAVRTSARTRLVPQTNEAGEKIGDNVALMTEVKQTLAPIVLFQGIPGAEITINLLGEWTMRAVATGIPGQAYIQYMPGTAGNTPVLSITNSLPVVGEAVDTLVLTLNQLLGLDDVVTDLLGGEGGLLNLGLVDLELNPAPTVVENPDGTSAVASVDVARVALLPGAEGVLGGLLGGVIPGGLELADVRIGHMEAAASVPAGGIICPDINVSKTANPDPVNAGSDFTYTITVNNPYDCTLTDVRVVDTISTSNPNIKYTIRGQDPAASSVSENRVLVWNDVGPIEPRRSKELKITVNVSADSKAGNFIDVADVTANCGLDSAQGGAKINLALKGGVRVEVPRVQPQVAAPLPRTGGTTALYVGGAVGLSLISLLSAAGYRRLRRAGGGP